MENERKKQIRAIKDHGKQLVGSSALVKKDNYGSKKITNHIQKKYLINWLLKRKVK